MKLFHFLELKLILDLLSLIFSYASQYSFPTKTRPASAVYNLQPLYLLLHQFRSIKKNKKYNNCNFYFNVSAAITLFLASQGGRHSRPSSFEFFCSLLSHHKGAARLLKISASLRGFATSVK